MKTNPNTPLLIVLALILAAAVVPQIGSAQHNVLDRVPSKSITGTTTNDSAAAGAVGEVISSTVASGSAVSLTSPNAANMTSVSLTAGDWDATCNAVHNLAGTTTLTIAQTGISTTSATLPTLTAGSTDVQVHRQASAAPGGAIALRVGPHRLSLAATTTVYCVCQDTFATSTNACYGTLSARRMR